MSSGNVLIQKRVGRHPTLFCAQIFSVLSRVRAKGILIALALQELSKHPFSRARPARENGLSSLFQTDVVLDLSLYSTNMRLMTTEAIDNATHIAKLTYPAITSRFAFCCASARRCFAFSDASSSMRMIRLSNS